jgi:hypothetical protein
VLSQVASHEGASQKQSCALISVGIWVDAARIVKQIRTRTIGNSVYLISLRIHAHICERCGINEFVESSTPPAGCVAFPPEMARIDSCT